MGQRKGIYKRKDGRYEARYKRGIDENGKTLYGSVYGNSEAEVEEKRRAIVGDPEDENKMPREMNLLILGAGSHGRDIKEIADTLRIFKKISFLDDQKEGEDIIGKCSETLKYHSQYPCAFVAIGDNKKRKKFAKLLREQRFLLPNIISPAATVSPNAKLGEGVAILPQSRVAEVEIGDFCILASNSLVNIDAKVGAYSHIDCGGIVLKNAKVAEETLVKSGEIVK